jgi:hypothetical protein
LIKNATFSIYLGSDGISPHLILGKSDLDAYADDGESFTYLNVSGYSADHNFWGVSFGGFQIGYTSFDAKATEAVFDMSIDAIEVPEHDFDNWLKFLKTLNQ